MEYLFNADDFGRTQTVNQAIVEGFQNNCLDRTTIMVNMPFFEEAVRLSEEYCFKDKVGLHINITSGIPLTDRIKQCPRFCTDGRFNGRIFLEKKIQIWISKEEKEALRKEISAQAEEYLKYGFKLMHMDSHGHIHTFLSIFPVVLNVFREKKFTSMRLSLNIRLKGLKKLYKAILNFVIKSSCEKEYKVNYFGAFKAVKQNVLLDNRKGKTEIMLHPNIYDEDMQIGEGLHYYDIIQWKKGLRDE